MAGRDKEIAMTNGKYSEVKTLDFPIDNSARRADEKDRKPAEAELNRYLADGWELITMITHTAFDFGINRERTNHYAVVGKPRV